MEIKMNLTEIIFKGKSRLVYKHPTEEKKCIKIANPDNLDCNINLIDLKNYKILKKYLNPFLPHYEDRLLKTDKGLGLVSEMIIDHDNKKSLSIGEFKKKYKKIPFSIQKELKEFIKIVIKNKLFLYDYNFNNFIIQEKSKNVYKLYFIDCKSLNKSRSYIPIEKISFFALIKLKRRIKRFLNNLYS
ncbi:MAG: hypothetical protein EOM53_01995 [Alphaproteobacteria bacterium]|nr:hypothetical protein [Alphaproteobacteria bacterium]